MKTQIKNSASIVPILQECERVIDCAITHFGLTVKPAQITLTVQSKGRKNAVGWFAPERWKRGAAKTNIHEINVSAECITTHDMGELMLHELAHAENNVLGIQDCSSNQMHNKKFKSMAEKLGLEVKPRDKRYGYGFTDLGDGSKKFLASIKFDKSIFDAARLGGIRKKGKVGSRLIKCECGECGYVVRTTNKWIESSGAPICPCNESAMEVAQ
jgi:hypothetical protein